MSRPMPAPAADPQGLRHGPILRTLVKLAQAAGVKKVVLTHFVPGADDDPESAYIEGVKKYFVGPVIAAEDLMQV
jgi:ribonuclease BN (tRNA processing enzyme)